jgi:hypothetical protein
MATILLDGMISAIIKLAARFGRDTDNVNHLLGLLKWQTVLIVLTVLLGQFQQAAMCGNLDTAGLWSGLALTELGMALLHYSTDA